MKEKFKVINRTASQKDAFFTDMGKRILIATSAFFLYNIVSYIVDPLSYFWQNYFQHGWRYILADCTISFLFCFAVSEASILIGRKLDNFISWKDSPVKRLLLESTTTLATVLILLYIQTFIFLTFFEDGNGKETPPTIQDTVESIRWLVVSLIISFAIMAINTGDYLIASWKNAALNALELNQLAVEAELQSLKLQLDPHFVFNNLSVLSELILTNQQLGHEYAENFTKLYRYLLIHSKKDLVQLEDEIKFLNAYIFLLEQRIGSGVRFEIAIDEAYYGLSLPPMTLQMLVENALKHNKTLRTDPLLIRIGSDDKECIVVENTRHPLERTTLSSGIGISNIIRRYRLLGSLVPSIDTSEQTFSVTIPLLK
ncbi:sensor histidine kinase [Sphingobacterium tabacisoli]|uniref:Sensor histidine kinase n=1 Tax=Sphingobacterium tabacisoli TaxID=2044855 RepID=A0ABW5L3Z1_9SPHI|nr:histidine kinase [Sphingobacterium tabacisoli]